MGRLGFSWRLAGDTPRKREALEGGRHVVKKPAPWLAKRADLISRDAECIFGPRNVPSH